MPAETDRTATTCSDLASAADASSREFGPAPVRVLRGRLTYRWREHVGPGDDYHLGYRTESEAEPVD